MSKNTDVAKTRSPTKNPPDEGPCQPQQITDSEYTTGPRLYLIAASLALCIFLAGLDGTIVSTAIPAITDEFHSLDDIGWYGSAFFLTSAAFQAAWGKALKHFGLKPTFLTAFSIFQIGSLVCATTPTSTGFIIGRAMAGMGASGIQAGGYTILACIVEVKIRPVFLAIIGAFYALAAAVGPVVGGGFTRGVGWRWCFYINLPLGGPAIALMILCFKAPKSVYPPPLPFRQKLLHLNPLAVLLILASLICFSLFTSYAGQTDPWNSATVIGLLVGSILIAAVFMTEEIHSGERALLQPRLFKLRAVAIACPLLFFLTGVYTICLYYIPLYFQSVRGVSAEEGGVRTLPLVLSLSLCMLAAGNVIRRVGYYKPNLILGSILATVGCGLLYTWDLDTPTGKWIGYQILVGAGIGTALYAPLLSAQAACSKQDVAPVTSMVCFFQALAGALFLSSAQCAFANTLQSSLPPEIDPARVLNVAGASSLQESFQGEELEAVREAYMRGLRTVFVIAVACGGVWVILSAGCEWRRINGMGAEVKGEEMEGGEAGEVGVQEGEGAK